MELVWVVAVLAAIVGAFALNSHSKKAAIARRRAMLLDLYGDPEVVQGIMDRKVWVGMTAQQLKHSWGEPAGMGSAVKRGKQFLTFKYHQTGVNRFNTRVYLEDDLVTGWEKK